MNFITSFTVLSMFLLSNILIGQTYIELPSIDGPPTGFGVTPVGYARGVGSPDIFPDNGTYVLNSSISIRYENINGASTSGGAFASVRGALTTSSCSSNCFQESYQTTLTGLTPGTDYFIAVEWQQSRSININSTGLIQPRGDGGRLRIQALGSGSAQVYTSTATSSVGDTWQLATYTFTAASTDVTVRIGMDGGGSSSPLSAGNRSSIVFDAGNLASLFSCNIDDPGAIAGTCTGNNNLEFTTTITASNTTSTYSVTSGGVSIATGATYGTPMTFTIPDAADGTDKMITVTDDADTACTLDITITGAAACFSCPAGTDGPRFLGLTRSTWMTIGLTAAVGAGAFVLLKKFCVLV